MVIDARKKRIHKLCSTHRKLAQNMLERKFMRRKDIPFVHINVVSDYFSTLRAAFTEFPNSIGKESDLTLVTHTVARLVASHRSCFR